MTTAFAFIQVLNGLQFGMILFLIATVLTLVFGTMGFVNLANGVQYMMGAYFAATFTALSGSDLVGLVRHGSRFYENGHCAAWSRVSILGADGRV
jgi:branched-chain amino acid transport system permease protein